MVNNDSKSYDVVRELALEKRKLYTIDGRTLNLLKIRQIYKAEGISIVYRTGFKNLKALYMADEDGIDVLCSKGLPDEPKLFALIHELKHHYLDRGLLCAPCCMSYDQEPLVEKTAEVFASEFIWPIKLFKSDSLEYGLRAGNITPADLVKFKMDTGYPVSYTFVKKRFEITGLIQKGSFDKVSFRNLQYELYGEPIYLKYRR